MADRVTIRVSAELISALDRFIAAGVIPARSRQDAFRYVAEDWLSSAGYLNDGLHPNVNTEVVTDHRLHGSTMTGSFGAKRADQH